METSWTPKPLPQSRYNLCDDTCTTDCGACKGQSIPTTFRDAWSSDPDRTTHNGDTRTAEQIQRDLIRYIARGYED